MLRELERAGDLIQGELRPGGHDREWCDPEVLRRLRRASLATLRKEVEPAEQRALARFLPAWQGVDPAAGAARASTACASCSCRCRAWRWLRRSGSATCCPAASAPYSQAWMDQLCASGELVWVGAGALGRRSGRVALYFREDARCLGPPPFKGEAPAEALHDSLRERLGRGAAFWTDLLADLAEVEPVELQEALWDLVWAGEVTNDAFAPLRAPRLTLARSASATPGAALLAAGGRERRRCRGAGR